MWNPIEKNKSIYAVPLYKKIDLMKSTGKIFHNLFWTGCLFHRGDKWFWFEPWDFKAWRFHLEEINNDKTKI